MAEGTRRNAMKEPNTKLFQKKLALKKEILRKLANNELQAVVAGGGEPTQYCTFPCFA
jgi:hypothetical protein